MQFNYSNEGGVTFFDDVGGESALSACLAAGVAAMALVMTFSLFFV